MSIISGGGAVVGAGGAAAGYEIERSLRFNSADSAYLNRTPASASNRTTWTWSGWVKRSALSSQQALFSGGAGGNRTNLTFDSSNSLRFDGNGNIQRVSSSVYRDPSAWYHVVWVMDTNNATAQNRTRIYVNSVEITAWSTNTTISSGATFDINTAALHTIGRDSESAVYYLNGYLTEINFIDGSALDPTSFGEFNEDTGVWQPIAYEGTYGTNGFYLNFSDNTSTTTLGDDLSGNGNDWSTSGFSVTAGVDNDSLVDTPTNYGTDTGVGGEVRGNYSTLNPLFVNNTYPITYSNGNLNATRAGGGQGGITNTLGMSSGKWYWEVVFTTYAYNIGITTNPAGSTTGSEGVAGYNGGGGTSIGLQTSGVLRTNGSTGSTYTSWTTGNVMGIALDMDGGNLYFYKDGTVMNSGSPVATSLTGSTWFFITSLESGAAFVANFGQRPFAYTAPSGFKALVTTNLPTPTIEDGGEYFNVLLYTGNSTTPNATRAITGVGFQPDFVWIKNRSAAPSHLLQNAVVGANKLLFSDGNSSEQTDWAYGHLNSFDSDGFTVDSGSDSSVNTAISINRNNDNYVSWNWKANGAGVSNTDGTITSTVSANTDSGFSIVSYSGNSVAGATVGHGLGVTPSMIIVKSRTASAGYLNWGVYHVSLGATKVIYLNTTGAESVGIGPWNDTAPTSTVFSLGNDGGFGFGISGQNYVAYCFAAIPGYSAFGSYTGNGSADGSFIYTGFRPRFVMVKRSSAAGEPWQINDTARNPSNLANLALHPNTSDAEATYGSAVMDILSNGFKLRGNDTYTNASGSTYIYMAFAENPFKYALAR